MSSDLILLNMIRKRGKRIDAVKMRVHRIYVILIE